jgi:hypothetical protein
MFHRRPRVEDPAVVAARARLADDKARMDKSATRIERGAAELRRQVRGENHISASVAALLRSGRGTR